MPSEVPTESHEVTNHWDDDKLGRKEQADLLTNFLMEQYKYRTSQFVLNINSSWGFGKTFFLERWRKDLEEHNHIVLGFNAWENDYSKDPLMSFLYEISSQLSQRLTEIAQENTDAQVVKNADTSQAANEKLTAFLKSNGFQLMRSLVTITTGLQLPDGMKLPADPYEAEKERKNAVEGFKEKLSNVINTIKEHENAGNKYFKAPLFIFIDELDRCRPNFTIELIEVVKHICNVDNIFFVFATDGDQLQASLCGMYGPGFDAEVYFNRIFSREVHLRLPDNYQFAKALAGEYGMIVGEDDLNSLVTCSIIEDQPKHESFFRDFEWVSDAFVLDMRSQHQLAATFDVLRKTRTASGEKTFTVGALVLILLWQRKKQIFKDLVAAPWDFENAETLANRLRDLGAFDASRTQLIACPTEDAWDYQQTSITEVMASFLSLLSADRDRIRELSRGVSHSYLFVNHICESAPPPKRTDLGRGIPSLLKMIDQIMLAA
ncbi:KAP family P-loop NTPase fold protein [Marinobacter xiaoshiensis]|uniref:P-loop NTPase fold protein n=1 Tax=Marinobacter xiaoshiensis TaxID=3073652 RepID=A0ABU2HJF3_9GAMM|nr:P-loop NTPase fold protein [Marinobacter sp. F60267]MDS1311197.1 P-loop NTPase fold protein [Marinobacter sp. F60267]